jgi:hypothetical protein
MALHHDPVTGEITIVRDRTSSDLAKSAGEKYDIGEHAVDEANIRDSQARASGKGAAWTKRRNGFRSTPLIAPSPAALTVLETSARWAS